MKAMSRWARPPDLTKKSSPRIDPAPTPGRNHHQTARRRPLQIPQPEDLMEGFRQ
ncbi:hypothetical protein EIB18_02110 [Caulobacter vibrioides]|uniref:Uncharacterized protein n=1 Tax=Caulobacter vibrioides (strain ATCC 19089 / CIP 103742 / CB 15) TaxID=190650 RepID=Q9AB21_CAUVC|nr:hypothetical protein CC_0413 [Caulobacter vibrioides CB15]ATC23416.1 hypothetical protein CA608_02115 [Caulobacter vibrioides]ATC27244.1 hypothetical protein CA607_02130 [Caulobacter vibrioides]AZH11625.1 hypothetical protein EIB18_02110 [Caulobacter vibrioides]PLR11312.1 hypothetical protein CVUC_11485 [Caulobacter vibrioides]